MLSPLFFFHTDCLGSQWLCGYFYKPQEGVAVTKMSDRCMFVSGRHIDVVVVMIVMGVSPPFELAARV